MSLGQLPPHLQNRVMSFAALPNAASLALSGRAGRSAAERTLRAQRAALVERIARHLARPLTAGGPPNPHQTTVAVVAGHTLHVFGSGASRLAVRPKGARGTTQLVSMMLARDPAQRLTDQALLGMQGHTYARHAKEGGLVWARYDDSQVFVQQPYGWADPPYKKHLKAVILEAMDRAYDIVNADSQARGLGAVGSFKYQFNYPATDATMYTVLGRARAVPRSRRKQARPVRSDT